MPDYALQRTLATDGTCSARSLSNVCGHGQWQKGGVAMKVWVTAMALLLATSVPAVAQDRFVAKLTLTTGQTVVVAEGDFEARSIGSFSVRLYEAAAPPNETTFFTSGLVRARDGVVEKVILADVDGDQRQEIVVIVRSAGTGGYLSAHAIAVVDDRLVFRSAVDGLAADADPVAVLRTSGGRRE